MITVTQRKLELCRCALLVDSEDPAGVSQDSSLYLTRVPKITQN